MTQGPAKVSAPEGCGDGWLDEEHSNTFRFAHAKLSTAVCIFSRCCVSKWRLPLEFASPKAMSALHRERGLLCTSHPV